MLKNQPNLLIQILNFKIVEIWVQVEHSVFGKYILIYEHPVVWVY